MIKTLRQLLFDRELRIPEPGREYVRPLLHDLLGASEETSGPGDSSGGLTPLAARDLHDLVAEVAAWSWEISRETERLGESTPPFLRRAVEGLGASLQHHEVKIQDFSGKDFDIHETWDRVVSPPRAKQRPYIARMMLPRVFFRGELLKAGVPVIEDREEQI